MTLPSRRDPRSDPTEPLPDPIWAEKPGARMYTSADAFEEFFPDISAEEARHQLGPDGFRPLDQRTAREFIAGLERLFGAMPDDAGSGV
jgi:hypothetical protein